VKYVEALIGPDTVNTVPLATLDAYRDHGDPKARLEHDVEEARMVLERLPELGISLDHVTQQLEDDGVEKFNKPFDILLQTLASTSPCR
jgi:transaldolase